MFEAVASTLRQLATLRRLLAFELIVPCAVVRNSIRVLRTALQRERALIAPDEPPYRAPVADAFRRWESYKERDAVELATRSSGRNTPK